MVDQAVPPLSIAEAKARLLTLDEAGGNSPGMSRLAVPAAGAALLIGFLLSRRKRKGIGLLGLGAMAANPAIRSAVVALAGAAVRRFLVPTGRR